MDKLTIMVSCFIIIFIAVGLYTWEDYYSIFPIFSMVLGTITFWLKSTKLIRFLTLAMSPSWLIYNIIIVSYPGIMTEIFVTTSIIIGIIRFDILKKEELQFTN